MLKDTDFYQKHHNKYVQNTSIQVNNVWIFCIGFIVLLLKSRSLLDYTNSFAPNEYENNDIIILKYF